MSEPLTFIVDGALLRTFVALGDSLRMRIEIDTTDRTVRVTPEESVDTDEWRWARDADGEIPWDALQQIAEKIRALGEVTP